MNNFAKRCTITIMLLALSNFSAVFVAANNPKQGQTPIVEANRVVDLVVTHFFQKHNNFSTSRDVWGSYTLDLTFEAMLYYDLLTKQQKFSPRVLNIMRLRNYSPEDTISFHSQPFCSINFALFEATNNSAYLAPYVAESEKMRREIKRSAEGAALINHKGKHYILIDFIQEYAARMAKTGMLTGDSLYYAECVRQFRLYRKILRDPKTGLYSQGRGWLQDENELSPGAWSRGHGWLIRGIVTSLNHLPRDSDYFAELQGYLKELADALLAVQDDDGMWHQLLQLPLEDSYPESSGTGMIAYYLALACKRDYLTEERFRSSALKASRTLRKYVTRDGVVLGACKGPGPLRSIHDYYKTPAAPDDAHAPQALIYGMLAEILLSGSG